MAGRLRRRVARHGPEIALALVVLLSGVSLWHAWDLSGHLRGEAAQASRIYGRVIAALNDTAVAAQTEALLEVVREIGETGLPVIVTDSGGQPTAAVNLPDATMRDPAALTQLVVQFDAENIPIGVPQLGVVHYGLLPVGQRLRRLGLLQLALLACAVAAGIWAYRAAVDRDRDRMWVAMARESAHQLGTPLMSANAWVDRLLERGTHTGEIAGHLLADLERLHRVAQRFERIGRPTRRDRVAVGAMAERTAAYFAPRLPRHGHHVHLAVDAPSAGPFVAGDPVLLEWALEALVRNAVDALSGRDGTITLRVDCDARHAIVRVIDDGPGIAPEVRGRLFEPGTSTKSGGWGIGLALARRIVEEVHDGRLTLATAAIGTEFVLRLPLESA
ncbi:MAG: HAMP domain-containing histidine kinase [Gemmatimonadota bacterium]|nr:HAMP domain-containing histidine kinase [Gemmatimonadota bacterium]